jgi:PIN domain nuclease of toxin-antitoxin system
MVILDTCAMIEALKPSPSFSIKTARLMDAGAYIMSISFAEIACKIKIGKLELSMSSRDLFKQFSQIERIEIIDIGVNEWLDSIELIWDENRDPADRIITAFAIKNELPIVTTDKKIEKFYRKVIW